MSLGEVHIRRLERADVDLYREIRLRALATDPMVFSSNHERESAFDDETWLDRLCAPNVGIWGLFDGARIIGMTGAYIPPDDLRSCHLWGSWLVPTYRGRGLSRQMYRVRIAWARRRELDQVIVSHRASNLASKGANQRAGFSQTHRTPRTWPDGQTEDEVHYALSLVDGQAGITTE